MLFRMITRRENKKPAGLWVGFRNVFKLPSNNLSHCALGWTAPIAPPLMHHWLSFLPGSGKSLISGSQAAASLHMPQPQTTESIHPANLVNYSGKDLRESVQNISFYEENFYL